MVLFVEFLIHFLELMVLQSVQLVGGICLPSDICLRYILDLQYILEFLYSWQDCLPSDILATSFVSDHLASLCRTHYRRVTYGMANSKKSIESRNPENKCLTLFAPICPPKYLEVLWG